jgi:hypothetical protein
VKFAADPLCVVSKTVDVVTAISMVPLTELLMLLISLALVPYSAESFNEATDVLAAMTDLYTDKQGLEKLHHPYIALLNCTLNIAIKHILKPLTYITSEVRTSYLNQQNPNKNYPCEAQVT